MSYAHPFIANADQDHLIGLSRVERKRAGLKIWQRLLLAAGLLVGLAAAGFCFWIFGILMFTFALDGANGQQLPKWLDAFMLFGWPLSIGAVVVTGPALVAMGAKWWQALTAFIVSALLSAGVYMTGVVVLVSSL